MVWLTGDLASMIIVYTAGGALLARTKTHLEPNRAVQGIGILGIRLRSIIATSPSKTSITEMPTTT